MAGKQVRELRLTDVISDSHYLLIDTEDGAKRITFASLRKCIGVVDINADLEKIFDHLKNHDDDIADINGKIGNAQLLTNAKTIKEAINEIKGYPCMKLTQTDITNIGKISNIEKNYAKNTDLDKVKKDLQTEMKPFVKSTEYNDQNLIIAYPTLQDMLVTHMRDFNEKYTDLNIRLTNIEGIGEGSVKQQTFTDETFQVEMPNIMTDIAQLKANMITKGRQFEELIIMPS